MRIKLHLMGALKEIATSPDSLDQNKYLSIGEQATPGDLLRLFNLEGRNVLALINGQPVELDASFKDGDRVVLMEPNGKEG